ncbi:MAG: DUF4250 domain-containing protein [Verrucomicrobiota bacterium]
MNLCEFQKLDPQLLPGLLNTALRNDHESLDDLVMSHDIDKAELQKKLDELGYHYIEAINQYRMKGASVDRSI